VANSECYRKLAVVDHVQLPKIHQYHEVDRSQRYLESKGNIQKISGLTRDAADLIATSKVRGICVGARAKFLAWAVFPFVICFILCAHLRHAAYAALASIFA
jgi:hypothetical protein